MQHAGIESIVRDAMERMRPQADAKHISLQLRVPRNVPAMFLDPEAVFDAIRNLLDNAIEYSRSESSVDVRVEKTAQPLTSPSPTKALASIPPTANAYSSRSSGAVVATMRAFMAPGSGWRWSRRRRWLTAGRSPRAIERARAAALS